MRWKYRSRRVKHVDDRIIANFQLQSSARLECGGNSVRGLLDGGDRVQRSPLSRGGKNKCDCDEGTNRESGTHRGALLRALVRTRYAASIVLNRFSRGVIRDFAPR